MTETEIAALKGELSMDQFRAVGMGLFQQGLVAFDPLLVGSPFCEFSLTETGRAKAIELRKGTQ